MKSINQFFSLVAISMIGLIYMAWNTEFRMESFAVVGIWLVAYIMSIVVNKVYWMTRPIPTDEEVLQSIAIVAQWMNE